MAKKITGIKVYIDVKKEGDNIQVSETAGVTVILDEYPELDSYTKGITISLTAAQEQAIIKHIKDVVLPQAEISK